MNRHVYGSEAMIRARCFEWLARFKSDRISLGDDKRSGRPFTSSTPENVETIQRLVNEDRRRSINDIAAIVDASYGAVQVILRSDLTIHRIVARFVPRLLTPDQKELTTEICQDLHQRALDDPTFMSRVIIGWVPPRKARQVRSATNSMLIDFVDIRAVVCRECVLDGQTFDGKFYCNVLRRLREDIRRKGLNCGYEGNWTLHDDDALSHRALVTCEYLGRNSTVTLLHPLYSPDLPPSDFFLFPKMKLQLKGHRFDTEDEIQYE